MCGHIGWRPEERLKGCYRKAEQRSPHPRTWRGREQSGEESPRVQMRAEPPYGPSVVDLTGGKHHAGKTFKSMESAVLMQLRVLGEGVSHALVQVG